MPEVREVLFPPDVVDKLWFEHGLGQWDVEEVVYSPASEPRWDVHPIHGGRVVVRGYTNEAAPRLLFVSLRPIDIDRGVWACITAFSPSSDAYGEEEGSDD